MAPLAPGEARAAGSARCARRGPPRRTALAAALLLGVGGGALTARSTACIGACAGEPPPHAALQMVGEQMEALRRGDVAKCYRRTAPATRAAIGTVAGFERILRESRELAPLIGFSRWQLLGSLPLSETAYTVRVRVTPALASSAFLAASQVEPIDYTWYFRLQTGQPEAGLTGLWMTEEIVPDFDAPPL